MSIVGKAGGSARLTRSRVVVTALLGLYFIYTFIPLLYVITASTKTNPDLFNTFGLWFAEDFHLLPNLAQLFTTQHGIFLRWLTNSFVYSIISALGASVFATLAGYAFAKYEFFGKKFAFALVLGAVMIPQTALVIPIFLMLSKIGLLNTPVGVILPQFVFPLGVFLMRAYVDEAVSGEIVDAGRMDGAGELHIFSSLAFRLLMPGFTTVLILSFVASWNNYFLPLVLLNSMDLFPVTVGLANWYATATAGSGGQLLFTLIMVGALVSVLPVVIAFLMVQRFWQGGLSSGGVKA